MTPVTITVLLTVLAGVVVVLTRVRLSRSSSAGTIAMTPLLGKVHTLTGLTALATWAAMLSTRDQRMGWLALPLWWITAIAGLVVLISWLPAKGRRAAAPTDYSWGDADGLSILAHGGLVVTVALFTAFLALGQLPPG